MSFVYFPKHTLARKRAVEQTLDACLTLVFVQLNLITLTACPVHFNYLDSHFPFFLKIVLILPESVHKASDIDASIRLTMVPGPDRIDP